MNSDLATSDDDRAIYLAPSTIRCVDPLGNQKVAPQNVRPHDVVVSSSSTSSISESQRGNIRLEAVEVDGRWFALDRDQLEFYQRLEQEGGCRRVRVKPVSITQLPDETKARIDETVASIKNGAIPDTAVIQGYQILGEGEKVDNNAMTDSAVVADTDHHSDSSADEDDSSSECGSHYLDWSEDEGDSSDENSDEEVGRKQRTLADGKSDSSSDENEHLLGDDS